jgi:hypothetical protein
MKLQIFNWLSFFSISLILLFPGCNRERPGEEISSVKELKEYFANPPGDYRCVPLWDWNGNITEEGIDFQMKEFKKAGIGGLFVHPRPGLLTEYLSEEWFHLFDYAVQKGREYGLGVWIYDENSYPSGFAGGHVPAEMPDSYRHGTGLSMEITEGLKVAPSDTIAVILKKTETGFVDVTTSADQEKGEKGTFYIFRKTYPGKSLWYGGYTYVDLIYPGVTQKFMEITMTKGYEKNLADFGKTVPGIFTDEPNLEAALGRGSLLRWTPDLWDVFQQRWGYDLKVNLPSLIERTGDWKKVRHDYYELILELFIDRWAKPWSQYCREKGLKWTGHYWEHGWPVPTDGSDEAAFYIWHQMPGVDMLGNKLDSAGQGGQFGNDRAIRELQSAANQAGWKRTLSETYGGGGWEMTFETQKRLVDWECVMGVNFVDQHLSYYSMNGVRKFDYPPSFTYHEPWWEHYHLMADYIGRICMALSSGNQINRTLLLQPNTTAWMYFSRRGKTPEIDTIRTGFKNLVYRMEQQQIEYDLGSENVLKTLGSVEGNVLRVGKRDYSLVVIPREMENIDQPTLDLLRKYLEGGGKILSFNKNIKRVNGTESPEVSQLSSKFPETWIPADSLEQPEAQNLLQQPEFSITDQTRNGMLYHQRRILEDGQLFFIVNSDPTKKAAATVNMKGNYVTLLDPVNGKIYTYPTQTENGMTTFQVGLEPVGSALFAITEKKPADPVFAPVDGTETALQPSGPLTVQRESDNILVVNYPDLKTSKSERKEVYFMNILDSLFKEKGVKMGNPWQHKIQYRKNYLDLDTLLKNDSGFEVNYHFTINPGLQPAALKTIRAVVERPELWQVSINGQPVTKQEGSYWIDRDFPLYAIGEFLKSGENTLTLISLHMTINSEVMPVYILGDFLVKPADKGFEITNGEITGLGSWREAGLPFYSQKVSYSQPFTVVNQDNMKYKIRLNKWSGSVAEVLVNGKSAGLIAWPPYELEMSSLLKEGLNEVTVSVTGSLKNTFGFFYQKNDGWIFGPWSWNSAPEKIPAASDYFLMDYGLTEPFSVISTAL